MLDHIEHVSITGLLPGDWLVLCEKSVSRQIYLLPMFLLTPLWTPYFQIFTWFRVCVGATVRKVQGEPLYKGPSWTFPFTFTTFR